VRLVIVGAGGPTRDLLRGLGQVWEPVVIDPDAERLGELSSAGDFEPVVGDGTDPEVLHRAGVTDAAVFIAADDSDDANLVSCRLAASAGVARVLAVAADPERLADYLGIQVQAFSPDRLAARRLEINLEPRRVSQGFFAGGMAEAAEFRIAPDSPMRGKRLADLPPADWLVVSILRGDRLIVPHGGSQLLAGDQVTVVGSVADYAQMVEAFTAGEASFPEDFGTKVVVLADPALDDVDALVAEAVELVRSSAAVSLTVVVPEATDAAAHLEFVDRTEEMVAPLSVEVVPLAAADARLDRIDEVVDDAAVVVVPVPRGSEPWVRRGIARLLRTVRKSPIPVLLARGSFPYRRYVLRVGDKPGAWAAAGAAIDLAAFSGKPLVAATVIPPAFIAGREATERIQEAATRLREEAAVQGVPVVRDERMGNPVAITTDAVGEDGLLVLKMPLRPPNMALLGTTGHIFRKARSSVLMVPVVT
jgi:trk system potassium uptake protein TrkA